MVALVRCTPLKRDGYKLIACNSIAEATAKAVAQLGLDPSAEY
jgi:hypothetical protein